MYDVTDRQTFTSIRNWVAQIQMVGDSQFCKSLGQFCVIKYGMFFLCFQHADVNVNKVLIGNKCDMNDQRAVTTAEGEALANEYNIHFFETSAKQDLNVEKAFITIATDVKDRMIDEGASGQPSGGHRIVAKNSNDSKKSCC